MPLLGFTYQELYIPYNTIPLFIVADYLEIPALVSGVIFYITAGQSWRNMLMISLLVVQAYHIFWISDEVVYNMLIQQSAVMTWPVWLAFTAIFVDYLELPVIYDLGKRLITNTHKSPYET